MSLKEKEIEILQNKQSVCSDAGEKDKSVNNDQWRSGTTVIVGGNVGGKVMFDAFSSTSREIQDNLLKLKSLVNEKLPQSKVWLSTPTLRTNNRTVTLTVSQ